MLRENLEESGVFRRGSKSALVVGITVGCTSLVLLCEGSVVDDNCSLDVECDVDVDDDDEVCSLGLPHVEEGVGITDGSSASGIT